MKSIFKAFLLSLLIVGQAYAQTASLLPNAVQQFFDNNGNPLSSGTVTTYVPNTTTLKTTWQDANQVTPWANPLTLNAAGRPPNNIGIFGSGSYRQLVKDRNGNIIWDQITSSTGSGGSSGPTATGDGDLVGTIKPWAGMTAPSQYAFAYGQEVSRTTFSSLFTAITSTQGVFCTSGSPTLGGLGDTTNFWIGMSVEVSCAPAGFSTIVSKTSSSVTLAVNSNVTTNTTATFFSWGRGNGTTTFNLPDFRGVVPVGNNNMGGVASAILTTAYFGSTNPNSAGALGGNQTSTLVTANLPPYTPAGTITNGAITVNQTGALSGLIAGGAISNAGGALTTAAISATASQAPSSFSGTAGGGTSVAFSNVTPSRTVNYIIKTTPDANSATASGVTSLGGMTGSITCGTGLLCTGNDISVSISPVSHPNTSIYATDYGVVCDNATDDSANLQTAINSANLIGNVQVILPSGTCRLNSQVYLNTSVAAGTLAAAGLQLIGQGKDVTKIDTRVANDFAIAVNPDWQKAFIALNGGVVGTGGSLGTNTYYVQITMTPPSGSETYVTLPKSFAVTSPGKITLTLPAVHTGYCYNIYLSTSSSPANYATYSGGDAICVAGNQTVDFTNVGSAHAVPTSPASNFQTASISNLSIINPAGTVGAGAISLFKAAYPTVENIYIKGVTTGISIINYSGDVDGSLVPQINNSKFDTISGWCLDAAGLALELSNITVTNSVFNLCGTLPTNYQVNFTITSISNSALPVVTTSAPHTLVTNDQIYIQNVAGMTLANGYYRVTVTGATTFNLRDLNGNLIDTTALGAYTPSSGTEQLSWRPPTVTTGSGAIRWLGLIGTFKNLGFTQNYNVSMYVTEGGTSDALTIDNTDFENTYGKGLYIASLAGGTMTNSECLSTTSIGPTISCVQLGTGFGAGIVRDFSIKNIKVRSDAIPSIAFEQYQNTVLGATYLNTNFVSNVNWQLFDAAGQSRFSGFIFPEIVGGARLIVASTNTLNLGPGAGVFGSVVPIKLKPTGEWVSVAVPTSISLSTGVLAASTLYNVYAYNSAATSVPYALALEINTTAPAVDQGYLVKTGDSTRTFVGQVMSDSGGNLITGIGPTRSFFAPIIGTAGQIFATTTNDNADVGKVGQYVESVIASGSSVAATTATPSNITSISIPAGDWRVCGSGRQNPNAATSFTVTEYSVSTTSATLDTTYTVTDRFAAFVPTASFGGVEKCRRLSVAATTTVYLVQQVTFTVNTTGGYGYLNATRTR